MEKIALAFRSLFSRSGWRLLQLASINRIVIPLFKLQSWLPKSYIPGPTTVNIEPTNRCNLNCSMCVRRFWDRDANPLGDMTFEFFEKHILGQLKPYQLVNLQCVGESLLNKDFLKMLAACKKIGCMATFTTNGVILRKHANDIVSHGADEICVSVDGIETMKKWRYIDVGKVFDGIDAVNEAKRRQNRRAPLVTVNCVVTRDSLIELAEMMEILGQKGVARVTLIHLVAYEASQVEQSVIPAYAEAEKVFDKVQAIARKHRIELLLPPAPGSRFKCLQPFRSLFINWDGDVRPCCMSTINEKGALLVGNVTKSSLPRLWNSSYMHQLRRALNSERNLPDMCIHCPMRSCDLESHTHLMLPQEPGRTEESRNEAV
jgi:radical SAM protein with 4Fe4S-binding SPASM domain